MRTPKQRHSLEQWERTIEDVDLEIAQLAIMCHIRLLEPGMIQRVLDNDRSMCHGDHANGFDRLRGMVFLHYEVQKQLADELGATDAREVVQRVHTYLLGRIGSQLGLPTGGLAGTATNA